MADKPDCFFQILKDIKVLKKGNLYDFEDFRPFFNNYMTTRYMSMDTQYIELINYANMFQNVLDKEDYYKLLVKLMPVKNSFNGYITQEKTSIIQVEAIAKYYEISQREAQEYIVINGQKWADNLIKNLNGKA